MKGEPEKIEEHIDIRRLKNPLKFLMLLRLASMHPCHGAMVPQEVARLKKKKWIIKANSERNMFETHHMRINSVICPTHPYPQNIKKYQINKNQPI